MPPRAIAALPVLLAPVLWWVVGFLPWLLGGRLDHDGFTGVRTPLPPLGSDLPVLVVGGALGGAVAVAVCAVPTWGRSRGARAASRPGPGNLVLVAAGALTLLVVLVLSLWTSARLDGADPTSSLADPRLRAALTLAVVTATAVGLGLGVLLFRAPAPLAAVSGAVLVAVAAAWLPSLVVGGPSFTADAWTVTLVRQVPWLAGAGVGVVLGVLGARPLARLLAWPVALAAALLVPALVASATAAAAGIRPGMVGPGFVAEQLDLSLDVLRAAYLRPGGGWGPWVLAVVVGAVVALARLRRSSPEPGEAVRG